MARVATLGLARQIEALFDSGSAVGQPDRELLNRFITSQPTEADAAFAAIVARHGPLVYRVCLQLLQDRHYAEDAFQAVFLVLARRATSIHNPDKLSSWLHGVVLRTARCLKTQLTSTQDDSTTELACADPTPDQIAINRDHAELLHQEINRLPQKYRLPILLCYFEGLTLDQAANHLAWPQGTLRSRLASAREKLKLRLTKRGVTLGAMLEPHGGSAHLPATLTHSTVRASVEFATGKSTGITISTAIATKILQANGLSQTLKLTTISLIPLLAAATASYLGPESPQPAQRPQEAGATKRQTTSASQAQPAKPNPVAKPNITVTGRVLDPSGKPLQGALVYLIYADIPLLDAMQIGGALLNVVAQVKTDRNGRFQLQSAKVPLTENDGLSIIATAPGFALGYAESEIKLAQTEMDIKLERERIVRVRLIDITGAPAAGVELQVIAMEKTPHGRLGYDQANDMSFLSQLPCWPEGKVSDAQGQLDIPGIPSDFSVVLSSRDMRFAQQEFVINRPPEDAPRNARTTLVLEPAQIIEGRVLAEDTGQPIPHATVAAVTHTNDGQNDREWYTSKFQADDQGRFKINPVPGDFYTLSAISPGGEPYLIREQELIWKKGAVTTQCDIKLPRGVSLRGKVTDLTTGQPIAGAAIEYMPATFRQEILAGDEAIVASKQDGSFQITVIPGKGYLRVFSPKPGYVVEEIGSHQLETNKPGGWLVHAHNIIHYDALLDGPAIMVNAPLRPGITIKGRVTGPKGEPIPQGEIIGAPENSPGNPCFPASTLQFRDSQFELHGLDPGKTTRVWLIDDEHKWGATIDLAAKEAAKDITVKLQPCGQAKAGFIGLDGKPIPGYQPDLEFIVKDGPHTQSTNPQDQAQLAAEALSIDQVDRVHYANKPKTDPTGRITFPALIPGAHYRINDLSTVDDPTKGAHVRKDFSAKPGETLELGDILIENPKP